MTLPRGQHTIPAANGSCRVSFTHARETQVRCQHQVGFCSPAVPDGHGLSRVIGDARAVALSGNTVISPVVQERLLQGMLTPQGLAVTDVVVHLARVEIPVPVRTPTARVVNRSGLSVILLICCF